jgi:hypothetical protein
VVLSRSSGFLHQLNWLPQYSWNIIESGIKHKNQSTNQLFFYTITYIEGPQVTYKLYHIILYQVHKSHLYEISNVLIQTNLLLEVQTEMANFQVSLIALVALNIKTNQPTNYFFTQLHI